LLHLNDRDDLILGRRTSYGLLEAALAGAVAKSRDGISIDGARDSIKNTPHRCVWEEMKRQRARPELKPHFDALPETLDW
jgi:hypothetical protein